MQFRFKGLARLARLLGRSHVSKTTGLTESEGSVMDDLVSAAASYLHLPVQHPDDPDDFIAAIHRCQDLLGMRVVRRTYPKGWHNDDR